ncbi:hypothetical protein CMV30_07680 [Nibricoccus aquaticus]|uniref:Outer membrane lipoprotein-sorting protein n=1 Tax=Nibricoccus aquaticus TaxID=2576891 RepID=A0A290Q574_9BACT|nr:hypothetical protein [Nibricoccus aquaticus]ATC63835.1 hypothetical protein CMV30_07680 [Nibricoccus aquaticus]
MKRLITILTALTVWSASLPASTPDADALLAKARAYLGGDAALDAINSIHYFGSIEMTETPAGATNPGKSSIEIIFQKPCQHRLVVSSEKSVDITGLDNYFGWRRVEPVATGGARVQNVGLGKEQIKRLRANTWENLYFWRGIEQHGGAIMDKGETELDGVKCRKLVMSYGPGIEFVRYFEIATGRLLLTETLPVGVIREEGEIMVAGVRFPRKLIATAAAGADGKTRVITITFDRIALNETFPASTFEQPLISGAR